MHSHLFQLIKTTRPTFLLIVPVSIFLGVAMVISSGSAINRNDIGLILIAALLATISANMLNEYFDFKSGLDATTQKTHFSGGSGALQDYPELSSKVLHVALVSSFIALLVGLYFVYSISWWLLPGGIISFSLVLFYTPFITRFPLLSLVAPGLALGLILVLSTAYILSGHLTIRMIFLALVPFFLINNLLLLNQFPDIEADRKIGRRNFPIVIGKQKSSWIFVMFSTLAYSSLISASFVHSQDNSSLLGILTLVFAIPATTGLFKYLQNNKGLSRCLTLNVLTSLFTPFLMAIGMIMT